MHFPKPLSLNRLSRYSAVILLAILLSGSFSACKSKKKNTFIKRHYHNITARYNGYFNAKNRLEEGKRKLAESHADNFSAILSVFKYGDEAKAKAIFSLMDEVVKKASVVIQRHEISKWVDDSYLLIGQSYFFKRDYFTAIETFQFINGEYKNQPVQFESFVWLARCYIQLNKLKEAESVLSIAFTSEKFPPDLLGELNATAAELQIRKGNHLKAIDLLNRAVAHTKKKEVKSRYLFIIAQLYEKENENDKSAVAYRKVIKANPPYELAFNARINSARLFQARTKASKKEIEKELFKLLRDDKNKDFKDQIYYALGNIAEKEKNYDQAIEYYRLSTASSVSNTQQKALSFLKLARLSFDIKKDYAKAQMYYDSTSTFLNKEHPDYLTVLNLKSNLSTLVQNLQVIQREDSLLKLSRLSEKDMMAAIDKVIKADLEAQERKEAEEKERIEQLKNAVAQPSTNPTLSSKGGSSSGATWYFYNTTALSTGYSEFLKQFGKRTLEDNWRRSSKESFSSLSGEGAEEEATLQNNNPKDPALLKTRYLKNIPRTPEQVDASNDKIINAYYNLGNFYKEQLIDYNESVKAFETLIQRYPDNKFKLETYYNLYRIYLTLNNIEKSEYYKNILLNEHPSSVYANIIRDPNYLSEAQNANKKADRYYEETYNFYLAGDYYQVMRRSAESDTLFPENALASKFALLEAFSIGKTATTEQFKQALQTVSQSYKDDAAGKHAADILRHLNNQVALKEESASVNDTGAAYVINNNSDHFILLIINSKININPTKLSLANFNQQYFSLEDLKLGSQLLNDQEQLLIIRKFTNKQAALNYYRILDENADDAIKVARGNYNIAVISAENFTELLKNKKSDLYIQFFMNNYLLNE